MLFNVTSLCVAPRHLLQLPMSALPAGASVTSTNTRRKRKQEEQKQATIRQHYYPEGGWGYVVVLVGFLVQAVAHGLQLAFGVLLIAVLRRFPGEDGGGDDDGVGEDEAGSSASPYSTRWIQTGKEHRIGSARWPSLALI